MASFTSVTVYEIVYGPELKGASSQLKKVLAWLKRYPLTTFALYRGASA